MEPIHRLMLGYNNPLERAHIHRSIREAAKLGRAGDAAAAPESGYL
jgi:hypothetical protein